MKLGSVNRADALAYKLVEVACGTISYYTRSSKPFENRLTKLADLVITDETKSISRAKAVKQEELVYLRQARNTYIDAVIVQILIGKQSDIVSAQAIYGPS
jgi:hypothetical protein